MQRALIQVLCFDPRPPQPLQAGLQLLHLRRVFGQQQAAGALPFHITGTQVRPLQKLFPKGLALCGKLPDYAGWLSMRKPDVALSCIRCVMSMLEQNLLIL